jgi:2'-5' RNA ligase
MTGSARQPDADTAADIPDAAAAAEVAAEPLVKPPRRRMFFALCPDDATRAHIVRCTRLAVAAVGGSATRPENLHMTVAFVGRLTPKQVDKVRAVAPIRTGPIEILLDRQGFWSRERIVWLGPSQPPSALLELETRLWRGLSASNFVRERGTYRPHITLARRARAGRVAIRPLRWTATHLQLLESLPDEQGTRYELVDRWPL